MTDSELCKAAVEVMENAYAPYSEFLVGAALLCADGSIYTGCNIENSSYSATVCAERTAIFKAVSEGKKDFVKIAIAGGKKGQITGACPPCGVCRQVLSEFCRPDFQVLIVSADSYEKHTLSELLPNAFSKNNKENINARS